MNNENIDENVQKIIPSLPVAIQNFIAQKKLDETTQVLVEDYGLHIDQGTFLENELMQLLVGLKSPEEFEESLYSELPVSKQTVIDMIADINKEVFIPLRNEIQKGSNQKTIPQQQVPPRATAPQYAPSAPRPTPLPPQYIPQQPKTVHPVWQPQNSSIVANPALPSTPRAPQINVLPKYMQKPQPPKPVVQQNRPPAPATPPVAPAKPASTFNSAQPIDSSHLLEDHEEPHMEFHQNQEPPPAPQPQQPTRYSAPQNLPGAMPPVPLAPKPRAPHVPPPPYSSDPYREPIDE